VMPSAVSFRLGARGVREWISGDEVAEGGLAAAGYAMFQLMISGPIDYCGTVTDICRTTCMVLSVRKPRLGRQGRRGGIRPRTP